MGTVLACMAGYYVLNGQALRAMADATKWLSDKLPKTNDEK